MLSAVSRVRLAVLGLEISGECICASVISKQTSRLSDNLFEPSSGSSVGAGFEGQVRPRRALHICALQQS